jgi:hypothetical protein
VPTLLQALYIRNDPEMVARIESRREEMPAWIAQLRTGPRLIGAERIDPIIEQVFLRTVSRPPTAEETSQARSDLAKAADPIDGVRDLLWVLLNTREFSVNH